MAAGNEKTPALDLRTSSATEIGKRFDQFEDVEKFIRDYEDANFVKFYRSDSRTIACARKRLPKRHLEDKLKYQSIAFSCFYHGRLKNNSQGAQPQQTTAKMGCPYRIRFTATIEGNQLAIIEHTTQHNHPLTEESFSLKRRLSSMERIEAYDILEKKGKRSAKEYLKEKTGSEVRMRDLDNLAASTRQQMTCNIHIQAILDYLSETEDESSIVELVTNPDGTTVGIYHQDQEMKRVYTSYPQYLSIDATCKVNSVNMPLYVVLAQDGNGENEIVAIFLVLFSNVDSIRTMVTRFKEHNLAWTDIKVIMADKEFEEREVLLEEFPSASVQICLFHTLKNFKQELSKEYMGLRKGERSHCLNIMQQLATSKSEAAYMENYVQLENSKLKKVIEYYNRTWHINREEWVEGLKFTSVALKGEAPSKLESITNLLTEVQKSSKTAVEVMTNLKRVIRSLREEQDHSAAALLAGTLQDETSIDDPTLSEFQKCVTPFALKHIQRQLKLSWPVKVKRNIDKKSCRVKSSKGPLTVELDSCPCQYWQSVSLPCRHIFAVRRFKGLPLFDKEAVGSRWSMGYFQSMCRLSPNSTSLDIDTNRRRLSLLSRRERLTEVSKVTKKLEAVVAEGPAEKVANLMVALQQLLTIFQRGSTARVVEDTFGDFSVTAGDHIESVAEQVMGLNVVEVVCDAEPQNDVNGRPGCQKVQAVRVTDYSEAGSMDTNTRTEVAQDEVTGGPSVEDLLESCISQS